MVQRTNFSLLTNLGDVADPTLAQDAATKNYVDTRASGLTLQVDGTPVVPVNGVVRFDDSQEPRNQIAFELIGNNSIRALIDPNTEISTIALSLTAANTPRVTMTASASTTAYSLVMPLAQGAANTFLRNDGTGNLSWAAESGSGTVTSVGVSMPTGFAVANSPVTSAGTIAVTYSGQIPVASLGTGTPSSSNFLRGDGSWVIPPTQNILAGTGIDVTKDGNNNTINLLPPTATVIGGVRAGTNITIATNGVISATNSGTVTSVAMTVPTGFAISGSPITSSGTLALTYSGLIPTSSLGTGTASSTNFLRGDGTWNTPNLQQVTSSGNTTNTTIIVAGITDSAQPATSAINYTNSHADVKIDGVTITKNATSQLQATTANTLTSSLDSGMATSTINSVAATAPIDYHRVQSQNIPAPSIYVDTGLTANPQSGTTFSAVFIDGDVTSRFSLGETIGIGIYTGRTVTSVIFLGGNVPQVTELSFSPSFDGQLLDPTPISILTAQTNGVVVAAQTIYGAGFNASWNASNHQLTLTASAGSTDTLQNVLTQGKTANVAASNNLTLFSDLANPLVFTNTGNSIYLISDEAGLGFINGVLTLGNTISYTGIAIAGGQTTYSNLTATGSAANLDFTITPKGTGSIQLGSISTGIQVDGGLTTQAVVRTIGAATNIDTVLTPKGTGNTLIGSTSFAGLSILGGQANSLQLRANGTDTNIDIVLAPKGAGNLFPLGATLSSTLSAQPKISLPVSAGSTTLGFGTAGQVLTSNGTTSAPYWGNAGGNQTLNQVLAAGKTATSANSNGLTLFNDQTQPFSFSNNLNAITMGLTSAFMRFTTDGLIYSGNATSGITLSGSSTSDATIVAAGTATNVTLNLQSKGSGNIVLGTSATNASLSMAGNQFSQVVLSAVTSTSFVNCDIVMVPKGSGGFYPVGNFLAAGASNQPRIFVASGAGLTTLSAGTAGQVLTSNGTAGAPYWGNAGGGSGWAIGGNSFSDGGKKLLGTTSANPFAIIVNNQEVITSGIGLSVSSFTATVATFRAPVTNYFVASSGYKYIIQEGTANPNIHSYALQASSSSTTFSSVAQINDYDAVSGVAISATQFVAPATSTMFPGAALYQKLWVLTDTNSATPTSQLLDISPLITWNGSGSLGDAFNLIGLSVSPDGTKACLTLSSPSSGSGTGRKGFAISTNFSVTGTSTSFTGVYQSSFTGTPEVSVWLDNNTLIVGDNVGNLYSVVPATGVATKVANSPGGGNLAIGLHVFGTSLYYVDEGNIFYVDRSTSPLWTMTSQQTFTNTVAWSTSAYGSAVKIYLGDSSKTIQTFTASLSLVLDAPQTQIADNTSFSLGTSTGYNTPLLAANSSSSPSVLTAGTSGQVLTSRGANATPYWGAGGGSNSSMYWKKSADQAVASLGTVTFDATPTWTVGTAFGTMASTGVFTFTQTGTYFITFALNVSAAPDGWGVFSGDTIRYVQHTTILKGSASQPVQVTAVNQTFYITEATAVTVFGTGSTASALYIQKVS